MKRRVLGRVWRVGSRRQRDVRPWQRALGMALAVVQVGLLVAALRDIRRRPARQIRGRKPLWVLASFVNFVGPIAYFTIGRRRR